MSSGQKYWEEEIELSYTFVDGEKVRIAKGIGARKEAGPIGIVIGRKSGYVLVNYGQEIKKESPSSLERCSQEKKVHIVDIEQPREKYVRIGIKTQSGTINWLDVFPGEVITVGYEFVERVEQGIKEKLK